MKLIRGFLLLPLVGVFGVAVARAQEPVQDAIPDWPAPAAWSPHTASRGVSAMVAITSPFPFIGVTPCRQYDSRNTSALPDNTPRAVTITGAPCGIPSAGAVSLNVTVFDILGQGGNAVLKAGTSSPPTTAWLNYPPGQGQIGNAGVLPLNASGQIVFQVNQGGGSIDFTIDVNGYYAAAGVGTNNTFLGLNAGNFTMTGDQNSGFGHNALFSNTAGVNNTATGNNALVTNDQGSHNTASGSGALFNNSTGHHNTATGSGALINNVLGNFNTASGAGGTLGNTTGSSNIGIGFGAGGNLTTGSNNICIGNSGVAGESGTIRIGTAQTATFVAGVNGVMTGGTGTPVLIDANGQLGTISSSARFKDEIQDMGEATEGLLKLRPVTFRYKTQPEGRTQFGLIAEEVEKVMPELVVCSSSGEVETVLYHEMPSMLLNELQKQQRQIEELKLELAALRAIISQK